MGVRAADMPLDGSRAVLKGYGGEALWHERLPLYDMGDGSWVVLTPDEDMFIEDLSRADSLRICGSNRELSRGIGNGQSYRFSGAWYTPDELEVLREEAKLQAKVKPAGTAESEVHGVLRRRVPAGGGVPVLDEPAGPVGLVVDGSENNIGRGRTPARRVDGSEWVRDWKSLAGMIGEPLFPDWPLEVPRTTKWLVKEIAKSGGGPLQHHQRWKTHLRADDGDRSVHEDELLCMALEISGYYDQLDLSVLDGMELVSRRLQLIEESKAAGGGAACEGAKFFVGYRRTGALIAPELGRHVAHKLQDKVSVMKERRKHAEERCLARGPPAKGGKTT